MKILLLATVLMMATLMSCTKQNGSPTTSLNEKPDTTSTATDVKYTGMFMNGPYGSVVGAVKIYHQNGKLSLALSDVTISNGPDLHVYLSKEVQPINFIDLGKLKSTAGNQLYDISGMPDFSIYKYALIHCQAYNHLFGSAELKN